MSRAVAARPLSMRVERGQKRKLRAGGRGGMNIDEPEEKQRGRGADGEDGGDGRACAGAGS